MLILSRKKGETIRINNNIIIKVLEIREGIVRLGFEAPVEVPIHREELLKKENVK